MARSGVLSGRIDARDRAQLRHRRDRRKPTQSDPHEELRAWLDLSPFQKLEATELQRVDLTRYLQDTNCINLPASERLRQLAIHVELDFPDEPTALDRIYQAAIKLEPKNAVVWQSRGITAEHFAVVAYKQGAKERCSNLALECLLKADELDPNEPSTLYLLGYWHYEYGSQKDALKLFDQVIALEPKHAYSLLYRACCLQDAREWSAAVAAYAEVPLGQFTGNKAYIVDVVLENAAYCKLRAHQRANALDDFRRLLARLEKEPHRAEHLLLGSLREVAMGPLREELLERYLALAKVANLPS